MDPIDAAAYWNWRYRKGKPSAHVDKTASQIDAEYRERADAINAFIEARRVRSVLDIGSGDGWQAQYLEAPNYLGLEISQRAIDLATERTNKAYVLLRPTQAWAVPRDLHLSLDVLQHQTSDRTYRSHMRVLFSAKRFVIVAAPEGDPQPDHAPHIRYRRWSKDIPEGWEAVDTKAGMTFWERG